MLEAIALVLLCYAVGSWLMGKLAERPPPSVRSMSLGCGLFLVVSMGCFLVHILTDPQEEIMAAGVVVAWLLLGLMLLGKAIKRP